jgi:undecaprenyl-diphosphatase
MLNYILLGIIQGLTEVLPVSSSGHLVIMQRLLGVNGEEVALALSLHLGTCLALIIFFYKDILAAFRNFRLLSLIVVVTIITGAIGILGEDFFEKLFISPHSLALQFLLTGLILIATRKFMHFKREDLNFKDASILGIAQGLAIIPAISRSGITIAAMLFRKVERKTSFRFSFLASIPAVLGAAAFKAKDINLAFKLDFKNLSVGFIVSLLTGLLSLWILKAVLDKAKLHYFGYYCIFVALLTLWIFR